MVPQAGDQVDLRLSLPGGNFSSLIWTLVLYNTNGLGVILTQWTSFNLQFVPRSLEILLLINFFMTNDSTIKPHYFELLGTKEMTSKYPKRVKFDRKTDIIMSNVWKGNIC